MKTPSKTEMIVGFSLIVVCMVILSMFGVSAHKSMKNTLMIMGTSFICSMIYDLVGHVLKSMI